MIKRTISELHDSRVGHRKFAKVCDLLVEQGHEITNIVEYYEKFKFEVDNCYFEYSKEWKASAKQYVDFLLETMKMKKLILNKEI